MDVSPLVATKSSTSRSNTIPLENDESVGTRLHALLHSNKIPKDSEIPSVRLATAEINGRLAPLDEEISQVRDRLVQLVKDRAALMDSRDQHEAILSPLRRMPPEILAEIFAWTLPTAAEALSPSSFEMKRRSPWVLTHVCSHWRDVAISTPLLWSLLAMPYDDYDYPVVVAETQIQRSKALRIHLCGSLRRPAGPQTQMLQYLIEHSLRWEELSITITEKLLPLVSALRDRVPSLRRLDLQWADEITEEMARSVDFVQTASSLVDATVYRRYYPVSFLPPAHKLTRYCITAEWSTHREILSISPAVVEARVDIFPEYPDCTVSSTIIELLQLRRLYVSHDVILGSLKMPLLEQLTLEFTADDDVTPVLADFLRNSSDSLRRLGVRGQPSRGPFRDLLLSVPSLVELALMFYESVSPPTIPPDDPDDVIRLLEKEDMCPRLSHIFIAFEGEASMDYPRYLRMLQSRWYRPDRTLQAATIVYQRQWQEPDREIRAELHSLRQAGLDFRSSLRDEDMQGTVDRWTCMPDWI